ncbi:MAG: hypothetical protein ISS92_01140 [Candidatus Omnitrophica bacterium]|nr:hypothetical protein [Candidatus Omnitrophota bacterium]
MRPDSPEDRLLHLIKGKYKKRSDTGEATPAVAQKSLFTEAVKKIFLKNKIFKPVFLKPINRILVAVLIIASIYFLDSFLYSPYKDIGSIVPPGETGRVGTDLAPPERPVSPHVKDYSTYSRQIKGKNLFSAPFIKEEESQVPEIDITKRFNLVGIIAGDEPQAIIEDKEAQKTHYLYKGQSFSGVDILEIGGGKVVLSYKGRQIILVL